MTALTPRAFFGHDWYWLASDGRLFSSAREALVEPEDPDFLAWRAISGAPYPWPQDADGRQTNAALQVILDRYGLYVTLAAYAAARRYAVETGGIEVEGARIRTDRESQALLTGAYLRAQADPSAHVSFKAVDGFVTLGAEQIQAIALAVGAHVQACFVAEATVDAALAAHPPTMTTRAQVDAAFAHLVAE